jgi:cobalt transporter subunit CbtA
MFGRVFLAVMLAGIAAGVFMGVLQHFAVTPLILQAETFEAGVPGTSDHGSHDHGTATHSHESSEHASPSLSRTTATFLTTALAGAGWAGIAAGLAMAMNWPINRQNGLLWGMCGFAAVVLAPAAGLPPKLPGVPSPEIQSATLWWMATIGLSGTALWLALCTRKYWSLPLATLLLLAPHVLGAPQPTSFETSVPAHLIQQFVARSLAANAVFWMALGTLLGLALETSKVETT